METGSNKKMVWIVVGVVVLALIIWWMMSKPANAPVNDTTAADETTAEISSELEGLNDADMSAEFKDIDSDTQKL